LTDWPARCIGTRSEDLHLPKAIASLALVLVATAALAQPAPRSIALDVHAFWRVEGPDRVPPYYEVVDEQDGLWLRGTYSPGTESVTMGLEIPRDVGRRAHLLRWTWRARAFPEGGDECREKRGDSAASVSVAFKRGARWYILKYVWSSASPLGAVCDRRRGPLLARDTIVLERGGEPGSTRREVVDVRQAFIDHFANGDPGAEVPDLVGIGVMTDGDQTHSASGADWGGFELELAADRSGGPWVMGRR
jgi:hypothetical protein